MTIKLTKHNLPVYISEIIKLDQVFPEHMRASEKELRQIFSLENTFGVIKIIDNKVIGCSYGFAVTPTIAELYKLKDMDTTNSWYSESTVVLSEFRGKGIGLELLSDICIDAYKLGFTSVIGHFSPSFINTGLKLNFEIIKEESNWDNTTDTYTCCIYKFKKKLINENN